MIPTHWAGFDVIDIPAAPGFKVGRAEGAAIVLLTPADTAPEPPTQLQRISLQPSARLQVRHPNGIIEEGWWGLVQLNLGEVEYLDTFVSVIANVVNVVGQDPEPGRVSIAMRRLVRLFDAAAPPRGSVLGLWGELLLLRQMGSTTLALDSWHSNIDDRFDFAAPGSRLEVKTTTLSERRHKFSLEQLLPVQGAVTSVVSIMTTETLAGSSLQWMIAAIQESLSGDPERQMRVHEVVSSTLGPEWYRHVKRAFDAQQAIDSMRILRASDIPRVGAVPHGVTEVRFSVECGHIDPGHPPIGLSSLID
ncbi:PD-(D/E)XK motif protein [Janibacter melonis]|uniref:PD-(D/E)XK motif protein n=1 Tax=Janibacter melonis TaxID=262209 RepID=UPI0031D77DD6